MRELSGERFVGRPLLANVMHVTEKISVENPTVSASESRG
jgi:hypothetical protein